MVVQGKATKPAAAPGPSAEAGAPSIEKAARYRDLTCPRQAVGQELIEYNVYDFEVSKFKRFGLGTSLYFNTMQKLAKFFAFLTLLSIPIMAVYAFSSETNTTYDFVKVTLGNWPVGEVWNVTVGNTTVFTDPERELKVFGYPKRDLGFYIAALDGFYSLLFFLFVASLKRAQKKEEGEYGRQVVTIVHYSIAVTGLPKTCRDRFAVAQHFSRWGRVVDVALATNDHHIVEMYCERGQLNQQMAAAAAKGDKKGVKSLKKQIASMDKDINREKKVFKEQTLAAYVTFETQAARNWCIAANPDSTFWRLLCCKQNIKFQNHTLRVRAAPEPSNVLFRNLKFTNNQLMARRIATAVITFLVLVVSFMAVYAAQWQENSKQEEVCEGVCCSYSTTELFAKYQSVCASRIRAMVESKAWIVANAVVIVLVNVLLRVITTALARFEKHPSVSDEQTSIAQKLFVGTFFNTGLVLLFVNAHFGNMGPFNAFAGKYGEINTAWFNGVGASLTFTMIVNTCNPSLMPLFLVYWEKWRRPGYAKSAKTQQELNRRYAGRDFMLADRYAGALSTLFVTFFYGSGIPLMFCLGFMTFTAMYWADKTAFFRLYRIPPRFDGHMNAYALSIMQLALIGHLVMGAWFYTSPTFASWPSWFFPPADGETFDYQPEYHRDDFLKRFKTSSAFTVCALLLAALVLFYIIKTLLRVVGTFCCCSIKCDCLCRTHATILPWTYFEARQHVRLESYHLHKLEQWRDAYIWTKSKRQLIPKRPLWEIEEERKQSAAERQLFLLKQAEQQRLEEFQKQQEWALSRGLGDPNPAVKVPAVPGAVAGVSPTSSSPPAPMLANLVSPNPMGMGISINTGGSTGPLPNAAAAYLTSPTDSLSSTTSGTAYGSTVFSPTAYGSTMFSPTASVLSPTSTGSVAPGAGTGALQVPLAPAAFNPFAPPVNYQTLFGFDADLAGVTQLNEAIDQGSATETAAEHNQHGADGHAMEIGIDIEDEEAAEAEKDSNNDNDNDNDNENEAKDKEVEDPDLETDGKDDEKERGGMEAASGSARTQLPTGTSDELGSPSKRHRHKRHGSQAVSRHASDAQAAVEGSGHDAADSSGWGRAKSEGTDTSAERGEKEKTSGHSRKGTRSRSDEQTEDRGRKERESMRRKSNTGVYATRPSPSAVADRRASQQKEVPERRIAVQEEKKSRRERAKGRSRQRSASSSSSSSSSDSSSSDSDE